MSNFESAIITVKDGFKYYDVKSLPANVFGLPFFQRDREFIRIPANKLNYFSEGIKKHALHTSGVRLKFSTNSPSVSLIAKIKGAAEFTHMPVSGISGFDFYIGSKHDSSFAGMMRPGYYIGNDVKGIITAPTGGFNEWTVYLPLYCGIDDLKIGIIEYSILKEAKPFFFAKQVVFYGSSITQGGCASRPGNSYVNLLSRMLDTDIYNLGFSGSAKGEIEMAEYISGLDMSVLVIDYDHNVNIESLQITHEPFFRCIRREKPDLPVIIISRPDFDMDRDGSILRRNIIIKTWKNALESGDKNVYFIDGESLFGRSNRDSCTVDGVHPNDLGFMRMAETICPVLEKALRTR